MHNRIKLYVGLASAITLLAALISAPVAKADGAPQANDIVGVGSDTLQYILDFGSDGDALGDTGYNSAGNVYRVASFDSTPDANGRMAFPHNVLLPFDATVVLRAGAYPVQRPNGGDAAMSALLADTSAVGSSIDFATVVSAPTATIPDSRPTSDEATQAETNGWGGLEVFTLATDTLEIAAATTTNAPSAGLTRSQLQNIYTCNPSFRNWDSPALGGGPNATVVPMLPPSGSDLRTAFLNDLGVFDAGGCVVSTQDNDPTTIAGNPNAIEPFAASRLNLWLGVSGDTLGGQASNGVPYFHDQGVAYPGGPALSPGISLLPGYNLPIVLNVVYRLSDQNSPVAWQPGSALNWAQTLFCDPGGPAPFFQTTAGKVLIAEAGADPASQSCSHLSP